MTEMKESNPDTEAELARLRALIDATANHWLGLVSSGPSIPWEGGIDAAMAAGVAEITSLRSRLADETKRADAAEDRLAARSLKAKRLARMSVNPDGSAPSSEGST